MRLHSWCNFGNHKEMNLTSQIQILDFGNLINLEEKNSEFKI